jgi:hypothetical protein
MYKKSTFGVKFLKKNYETFPSKKDLFYWLLIGFILLIVVSIWRVNDPGILTNQLALGGTLLSIILAVVAIIFSFLQSTESTRGTYSIIERVSEVSKSISTLSSIKNDLESIISHQTGVAEEIVSSLNKIKNSTDDETLKDKAEASINEWQEKKVLIPEIQNSYYSWINETKERGKLLRQYILKHLDNEISLKNLRSKLADESIDFSETQLYIVLSELERKGEIKKMVYKNGDMYITKL